MTMSDTTSPSSGHLHPLSPSSSLSSTDSAPQSEPTSDEQPDLGAFTTVLRAWTYLQPPPRIPVQIYSPTTSATTTFQPDQSVVDSDFQSNSQALLASSSSFNRPPSGSVLHEDSTEGSHALQSFSSFTRPTSSSVLQEESTVWNHAPIASYLYSETPSIDLEDVNSVISTEGGRTVEINSEMSFDEHSSRAPSQTPCPDVVVPVLLDPSLLLPESDSSAPISHLNLPSSDTVSFFSGLSLLSYQIPGSEDPDQRTVISTASLKLQRSTVSNSMTTPIFSSPSAIPALPVHEQQQHRTVLIYPPTQSISDDASVSHLSLPPTGPPLPQPQPKLGIGTSVSSFTRGVGGDGQGTIVVDDLRTPDQTPDSFLVDWKRGGKAGGFRPVEGDHEEERGERKSRVYGLGFGFGRVPQGWRLDQKHVSGYTSNYEGSQSSFRARRSSEIRGRTTRLEPQHEDVEDSDFNSYAADHQDNEDQIEEDEEADDHPFPRYRRRSGEFHFQTHTPRYYRRSHTPPRGVLPTHPFRLRGQIRTQSSMEVLHGLSLPQAQAQAQAYKDSRHHSDLPDPYPRPHARPHVQDRGRDINSSPSSHSSSLPSISSSPSRSQIEPSPIQGDYVLIQPQIQLSAPVLKQSLLQQTQLQMRSQTQSQQSQSQPQLQVQAQAHTSRSVSNLSTKNQGLSIHSSTSMTTTTTALPPVPVSISAAPSVSLPASSSSTISIPPSFVPALSSSNKRGLPPPPPPPPSSSPSSFNPDNSREPMKRASWEYVDLEEDGDDLASVLVSEGSSVDRSSFVGVGVVSGDSGFGVGSGTSFGHLFPIAQLPQSTKQLQPITKLPSLDQQQRQLELQYQQTDVQTRPHVEPDSDGSEEEDGSTAAAGGASVLVSELITAAPTAPSRAISTTAIIGDFQSPSLNSIRPPIPRPIPPSIPSPIPESNPDSNPNLKFDACTNNHPKHTHTQSHFSNYTYPGFHSDSHVAHMEDTTESELDLDLDDVFDRDLDVKVSAVQRAGGACGDGLLPSLGYLDEALSFIAEERARWSAAREGGAVGPGECGAGTGGNAVVGVMFAKAGGKKMENRKVLDQDVDTPKRKRRRKRRQSQPPHALSNSTPGLLETPLPIAQHTVDEDGGGPSTSTSSTKRKRIRSSSWSPTKKKNNKGKEKEFLTSPPVISAPSYLPPPVLMIQGERDHFTAGDGVVFHSRSTELLSVKGHDSSKKDEDGDRTPTNSSGVTEDVSGPINTGPTDLSRIRNKMGKKEKERERVRKDLMIGKSVDKKAVAEKAATRGPEVAYDEDDHESDKDENDEEEDGAVSHDDLSVEDNSSLNNFSLLQPPQSRRDFGPRKKGKDIAHIHSRAGIAGAYKSTPGSPKRLREFDDILVDRDGGGIHGHELLGDVDVEGNEGSDGNDALDVIPDKESTDKKRALTKRRKGLVRVRSVPQLDAEGPTPYTVEETITPGKPKSKKVKSKALPEAAASISASALVPAVSDNGVAGVDLPNMTQSQSKRSRLVALAKELGQFFPEQRQELRRVTLRFEKQDMEPRGKGKKAFLTSDAFDVGGSALRPKKSAPMLVPGVRKSKRSIHRRSGSESAIVNPIEAGDAVDIDGMLEVEEEDELDPRGRPPKNGSVLIHVFIDHSNILIGLLSHLKRFPLSHVTAESKRVKRSQPIPTISAKTTPTVSMSHVTTSALAFAAVKPTSTRPLPNPNLTTSGNGKVKANTSSSTSIPIGVTGDYNHRIPLPSFATMSRSLPSGSALNEYPIENDDGSQIEKDIHSDAFEYPQNEDVDSEQNTSLVKAWKPDQKEKKSLKHLWHAALVLLLERGRPVTRRVVVTSSPLYQPMDEIERLGYELRVYVRVPDLGDGMDRDRRRDRSNSFSGGSKSVQSTPTNPVSYSELTAKKSKRQSLGHVRRISGSTSAESVSGGGSGSASSGTRNLHPYHGIANNTPPFGRIKYREQGVDELLQLKLHQALAATDEVPEGSTIVLATGDGNMGQFNEEGFLGPIRTALKRGWKVELYAWEDGLSRAWRREFGEGTEWGRTGMFRVIGMEQFAASLVDVIDL